MAQQQQKDYYVILDCSPSAGTGELQRRYREALAHCNPDHPDNANRKAWATSKTKLIVEAFNLLNDPGKRMSYDYQAHLQPRLARKAAVLKDAPEKAAAGGGLGGVFSRLFKKPDAVPSAATSKLAADKFFDKGVTLANDSHRFQEAYEQFRQAVDADRSHLEAAYNLALMDYKLGRFKAAIKGFRAVTELDPTDFYSKLMVDILQDDPEP